MSLVSVVCCHVEVSAAGRSLVQRSPADCGMSLCVINKPRARGGPGSRWAVAPGTKKKCEGPSVLNDWMHQNRSIQISVSRIQTSPRYGFRPSLLDVTRCR
jgi:hypothetical protein